MEQITIKQDGYLSNRYLRLNGFKIYVHIKEQHGFC